MPNIYRVTLTIFIGLFFTGNCFAVDNGVDIHGFIGQGYIKTSKNNVISDSDEGTFQLNEMGLNITNEPTDKLRVGIQFFARDFGSIGNDEIVIDWAFADFRLHDLIGIRGGKMKNPVGLYQETRDIDMLRTTITLPWTAYDENLRDTANSIEGIGIYGDFNTDTFGSFSYQILVGTNNVAGDGGTALYLGQGLVNITNVDIDTILNYALIWADPSGIIRISQTAYFSDIHANGTMQGASGIGADYDLENIEIYMSSIEATWNNFMFTYERYWSHSNLSIDFSSDLIEDTGMGVHNLGYYCMLAYRINDLFEVAYYYSEYFQSEDDRHGRQFESGGAALGVPNKAYMGWHKESSFSLRCDINSNWILKVEYHYIDGAAKLLPPLNDDFNRYWHLYMAKLSYNF